MSWWKYVVDTAGTEAQVEIAKKIAVDQSTVSRWKKTDAAGKAENVARLARAYRRPVLEAFVAAGFLTPEEARARPVSQVDYSQITNDELLELIRTRMTERGERDERPAATNAADRGRTPRPLSAVDDTVSTPQAADEQSISAAEESELYNEP